MLTAATTTQTLPAFPSHLKNALEHILYCQTTIRELDAQRQLLLQKATPVPQTPQMTRSLLDDIAVLCEQYTRDIGSNIADIRAEAVSFLALQGVHLNTPYLATIPAFYAPQTDPNTVVPQTLEITGFSICETKDGAALYLRLYSGATELQDTLPTELTLWR